MPHTGPNARRVWVQASPEDWRSFKAVLAQEGKTLEGSIGDFVAAVARDGCLPTLSGFRPRRAADRTPR